MLWCVGGVCDAFLVVWCLVVDLEGGEKVVAAFGCKSPYSSVVEHPLSKRKVGSSILPGGKFLAIASRWRVLVPFVSEACVTPSLLRFARLHVSLLSAYFGPAPGLPQPPLPPHSTGYSIPASASK